MTQATNVSYAVDRPMPAVYFWGMAAMFKLRQRRFHRSRAHHEARLDLHWLALLDAENVQTVILNRREDHALLRLLRRSSQWAVDFADRQSVILIRRATVDMVQ